MSIIICYYTAIDNTYENIYFVYDIISSEQDTISKDKFLSFILQKIPQQMWKVTNKFQTK